MRGDPLSDPTGAGVVSREREFARPAFVLDQLTEQRRAELGVESGVDDEAGRVELNARAPRPTRTAVDGSICGRGTSRQPLTPNAR